MSRRTTLVLAVILVVLLVGSYIVSTRQNKASETAPLASVSTPWLQLTNGEISNITILDASKGQKLQINQAAGGGWTLQTPITGTADSQQIDAWLGQWQFMVAQRVITPTTGLDQFGLVTPTLAITWTTLSNQVTVVHIGNQTPTGSGYYAQLVGSDKVAVISTGPINETQVLVSTPPLAPTATPALPTATPVASPTP
jgi:Domain of unknown function (DUF4340)